jgi:hypothetical protein
MARHPSMGIPPIELVIDGKSVRESTDDALPGRMHEDDGGLRQ